MGQLDRKSVLLNDVVLCLVPNLDDDDDDDDDDEDEDDELFLWYGWPKKGVYFYFQPELLSKILTIANFQLAPSSIWTCTEYEFRNKIACSSDPTHYGVY